MIPFQPAEGSVLYCDYDGFKVPEMIKKRPVIVIRRHRQNRKLVTVVPISLTMPDILLSYHIPMKEDFCKEHLKGKQSWVKCDMVNVISIDRLREIKNHQGQRYIPQTDHIFLEKVKTAIRVSQGL